MNLRLERPGDAGAIRAVQIAAFGHPDEADLVDALRESGDSVISVVAEKDGRLVGHVLFSRLTIHADGGEIVAALALAPMAVVPQRQPARRVFFVPISAISAVSAFPRLSAPGSSC